METSEFDAAMGGTEQLPHTANSLKFAASRSIEIAAMTESITRPSKTKLIFQNLPVHMRRRVMSHNCKRLPRRLREEHMEQLKKSGLPQKQKRPSRKYRRRPANLLDEYTRRQRKKVWLETHIWHAKRFHMVERWGHRLAYRPTDKAFRACYRASSGHCLMQDISYFTPVQIKGDIDNIKSMFSSITSNSCGLTITAKAFLTGNREGLIHLYRPNEYPFGFIGKVNFLWVPSNDSIKELWLFIHPAQAKQVEAVLTDIRNGTNITEANEQIKRRKIMSKYSDIQIKVILDLNRLRLTGPRSQAILVQTLKSIGNVENFKHHKWIEGTLLNNQCSFLKEKYDYWLNMKSVSSPSQLPPKVVIGLTVKDPRLSRPPKRIKAQPERNTQIDTNILKTIPPYLATSPLWDANAREIIKANRVTNAQFIEHITKTQLVPGEINEDDPKLQCIPIVLIQRPGSQDASYKKIGYGCGWDIIIPAGYSLPFWLTFVMFGARTGGLRETESIAFELGDNCYSPDSETGKLEAKREELELKEKYFKRPPSKRVNYIKLSVPSPFICLWQVLLNDWSEKKEDNFFVLRDKETINELQECLKKKKRPCRKENMGCLVGVYLQVIGKGNLNKHATICMPNLTDITCNKIIFEPHHEDGNAELRKHKRSEHIKNLKKIRRKIKCKSIGQKNTLLEKRATKECISNKHSEYILNMRELWLPSNIKTVRNSGIRQTMGYLLHGGFSFSEAKSCGVGYIAFNALRHLLENRINKVLVRNTSSRCYRLANFELIKSP